jgi:cytochrome c-type biogenesis protein CcsB
MKNFVNAVFSMQLTVVALLMFAISIAIATFIENDFGTAAAKVAVYNAIWFEVLLAFLAVNLIGSLIIHNVWKRRKYVSFFLHISFVVILIGAAITRYFGYEGIMHIREGESTSTMLSDNTYITARYEHNDEAKTVNQKVLLSGFGHKAPDFSLQAGDQNFSIEVTGFVPNAGLAIAPAEHGDPIVSLFVLLPSGRESVVLQKEEQVKLEEYTIAFGIFEGENVIHLSVDDGKLFISAPDTIHISGMGSGEVTSFGIQERAPFEPMKLYNIGETRLVLRSFEPSGIIYPVLPSGAEQSSGLDAVVLNVSKNNLEEQVIVWGKRGIVGSEVRARSLNDGNLWLSYGSRPIELPFKLQLNEFILERYPGSNSPASYASEVTLTDNEKQVSYDFRIYMNNILTHRGYRFYQSSYDADEKGTILSVNHDAPGTSVTYFGYAMMIVTMVLALIVKKTRFRYLLKSITETRRKKARLVSVLIVMMLLPGLPLKAQQVKDINGVRVGVVDKDHAATFGRLIVLSTNGRLEPVNTLNSKLLRKITGKSTFGDMNADQVVLGILAEPEAWQNVPLIKVKSKELKQMLGLGGNYASFYDFFEFDRPDSYKLNRYVEQAYRKNPFEQNQFDKDVISVDERVNIFYMLTRSNFLNLFPDINNPEERWYNPESAIEDFPEGDSNFVKNIIPVYLESLEDAMETGDYSQPDEFVEAVSKFQEKYAAHLLISEKKLNVEILYNRFEIFERLYKYYGMFGMVFLIILFINLVNPKFRIGIVKNLIIAVLVIFFIIQTLGLAARWYVSGHAPMSNGYESMIYIAWATMLAGIIFARKSPIALAATAVLASLTLFVAHLNWMNPEITNLVPVLQSVWLTIHVGIITASYGFLGLVMIMGIFNLLLMIFQNKKNYRGFDLTIKEISLTSEVSMTIGLYLLTIGSFLGGIWANESWGRYWGWDPKETWSLVTILVYAIILHMVYIPGLMGKYLFNAFSVIGFASVLMTYFGVNYYLAGLHSYAGGDPVPIPTFVYYTLAVLFILLLMAYVNTQRLKAAGVDNTQKNEPAATGDQ